MATTTGRGKSAPTTDETVAPDTDDESQVITLRDGVEVEDDDELEDDEPEAERDRIVPRVAEPRPPSLPRDIKRDKNGLIRVRKAEHPTDAERQVAYFDRDERHPTKTKEVFLRTGETAKVYPTPDVIRAIRDGRLEKA